MHAAAIVRGLAGDFVRILLRRLLHLADGGDIGGGWAGSASLTHRLFEPR